MALTQSSTLKKNRKQNSNKTRGWYRYWYRYRVSDTIGFFRYRVSVLVSDIFDSLVSVSGIGRLLIWFQSKTLIAMTEIADFRGFEKNRSIFEILYVKFLVSRNFESIFRKLIFIYVWQTLNLILSIAVIHEKDPRLHRCDKQNFLLQLLRLMVECLAQSYIFQIFVIRFVRQDTSTKAFSQFNLFRD